MAPDDPQGPPERPEYKVYRARRGIFSRLRTPDRQSLRRKKSDEQKPPRGAPKAPPKPKPTGWTWRRGAKWLAIAAGGWILLSILAFMVSAGIQSAKLANPVGDVLNGNPFLAVDSQTILVLGSDVRPSGLAAKGQATPPHCVKAASRGERPPNTCNPYRSDTLLLVRA